MLYFNFCHFRALSHTTVDKELAVFLSIIFAVLLKFENTEVLEI